MSALDYLALFGMPTLLLLSVCAWPFIYRAGMRAADRRRMERMQR